MEYFSKYQKYKIKYIGLKKKLNLTQYGGLKHKNKLKRMETSASASASASAPVPVPVPVPNYTEKLSEPWFSLISLGLKTVEGRKNKGRFKEMKLGDIVEWTNNDFAPRSILTEITGKTEYNTFKEYLETEGLEKCLPGIPNLETGLSVYYKYFTKEDEKEFGVVAITMKLL